MIIDNSTRELPFSIDTFHARQDALRARLEEKHISAAVYFTPEEIYYLTGYNTPGYYYGFQALVVPVGAEAFLVCRLVEESNVYTRSVLTDCEVFTDVENPAQTAARALKERGFSSGSIAMDPEQNSVSPAHYIAMKEAIGEERVVAEGRVLGRLRAIKSDEEIAYMRRAAECAAAGMRAGIGAVEVGALEDDIAAAVYEATIRAGGEYPGMPPMIASGPRAGIGHATWEGHRQIMDSDVVILEIPGCVARYHACQLRCIAVGPPSEINRERMDVVLAAREAALSVIRRGVTSEDVDRALRVPIAAAGLERHHLHRAGYGLGIAYPPHWDEGYLVSLREGERWALEPNIVFHLLPALYFFNETLIGCTETVRVTETGYELLTSDFAAGFLTAGTGEVVI